MPFPISLRTPPSSKTTSSADQLSEKRHKHQEDLDKQNEERKRSSDQKKNDEEAKAQQVSLAKFLETMKIARETFAILNPGNAAEALKQANAALKENPESIAHLLNSIDFNNPYNVEKVMLNYF